MVKKNQGNKLEPLHAKIENNAVLSIDERKLSHRLNALPNNHVAAIDPKRGRSKIPVLQKKAIYPKSKKDDVYYDTSLSAADRRQKFQQSRLNAAGAGNPSIGSLLKKQPATQYCYDVFPWYESYVFHKVLPPPVAAAALANHKSILPPIKPLDISVGPLPKINQTKNKSLLGEFTHFPSLCNPVKQVKKQCISTIPHLPPIVSLPPAPPPSISSSLEKDQNHANKKDFPNKWNVSTSVFQNGIPVLF